MIHLDTISIRGRFAFGVLLILLGVLFGYRFLQPVQFSIQPQMWFSADYYQQFIPVYLAGALAIAGFLLALQYIKANFYLALFGHATSEAIVFHWIGLEEISIPWHSMLVLFPLSLLILWVAYSNVFRLSPMSFTQALMSIGAATLAVLFPTFFN